MLDYIFNMKNWSPKNIKDLRRKYKLYQQDFGKLLGVTANYIYLMEKGVKKPSKTLRLLLDCREKQLHENKK